MKRLESDDQMPYALARHYAITGENKKALDWLEAALEFRIPGLVVFIGIDPLWDSLREEPRFQEILTEMGLV